MTQYKTKYKHKITPKKANSTHSNIIRTRSLDILELARTRSNAEKYPKHLSVKPIAAIIASQSKVNSQRLSRKGSPIIGLVGRKQTHKYALTMNSNLATIKLHNRISQDDPNTILRILSELTPCTPAPDGKKRAKGLHGTHYKETLRFNQQRHQEGVLYMSESPENIKNKDIEFEANNDVNFQHDFFKTKKNQTSFSFNVTANGISQRSDEKRPCSQKKIANGYSAADIFKALGVQFDNKISRYFHLAHRIGWGLGGSQVKDNIDPATAGSNYTTLFYIEDTIRLLLTEKKIPEVSIEGNIQYHKIHKHLPEVITYTWSWGNGNSMSKSIYPLSKRQPTLQESLQVRALASAINESNSSQTPTSTKNQSEVTSATIETQDTNHLLAYAQTMPGSPIIKDKNDHAQLNLYTFFSQMKKKSIDASNIDPLESKKSPK